MTSSTGRHAGSSRRTTPPMITGAAVVTGSVIVVVLMSCCTQKSNVEATTDGTAASFEAAVAGDSQLQQQLSWGRRTRRALAASSRTKTDDGYVQLDAEIQNTSSYEQDTVRIKCDITGYPLPRYQWYKDGILLHDGPGPSPVPVAALLPGSTQSSIDIKNNGLTARDRRRFNVKTTPWGSRLKITNATMKDAGVYTCEGFNQYGRQLTSGLLTVRQGLNPNRNRQDGRQRPTPEYDDDDQLDPDIDDDDIDVLSSSRSWPNRVGPSATGSVRGSKVQFSEPVDHSGPGDVTFRTNSGTKVSHYDDYDDETAVDYEDLDRTSPGVDGSCQTYHGSACSRYIGNRTVFVWSGSRQSQWDSQLLATFKAAAAATATSSTEHRGSSLCADHIVPLLCFVTFPPCRSRQTVDAGDSSIPILGSGANTAANGRRSSAAAASTGSSSSSSSSGGATGGSRVGRKLSTPSQRGSRNGKRFQSLCFDECSTLESLNCRAEFWSVLSAIATRLQAAAASETSFRNRPLQQQPTLLDLLKLSWCDVAPSESNGKTQSQQKADVNDDESCYRIGINGNRQSFNVSAELTTTAHYNEEFQLRRVLMVVVPCAAAPLLIGLLMVALRRCHNNNLQQQQQQLRVPVKTTTVGGRVVSLGGPSVVGQGQQVTLSYIQQQPTPQQFMNSGGGGSAVPTPWAAHRTPSLSYSDACSWTSSSHQNELGLAVVPSRRQHHPHPLAHYHQQHQLLQQQQQQFATPPLSISLLTSNNASPWSQHRTPGAEVAYNRGGKHVATTVAVNHNQPSYAVRQQHSLVSYIPQDMTSASLHCYGGRPFYCIRRPGTPGSATTSGQGSLANQKPSPTPSVSLHGNRQLSASSSPRHGGDGHDGGNWSGGSFCGGLAPSGGCAWTDPWAYTDQLSVSAFSTQHV